VTLSEGTGRKETAAKAAEQASKVSASSYSEIYAQKLEKQRTQRSSRMAFSHKHGVDRLG